MSEPETHLPKELLERASLRGKEYAWRIDDIPKVIEAAQKAGLVNIGGQLQFRLPDGGTCECYWVEVDTNKTLSKDLHWGERVIQSADLALADFARIQSEYDFLQEGWRAYNATLMEFVNRGGNPAETMCFVWYVMSAEEAA